MKKFFIFIFLLYATNSALLQANFPQILFQQNIVLNLREVGLKQSQM